MKHRYSGGIFWLSGIIIIAAVLNVASLGAQGTTDTDADPYNANNGAPDPRYKSDILLVVAHAADEILVSSYLAREILDDGKKVAAVYVTPGDASYNEFGLEQARAMGEVREIETRQALASLGISNVWFLSGRDTASQNVLNSLGHWGHGSNLDQLVRIVRLTRPSVILTFLPDFTTGENHADHQAAGVIATEAFDLAGNPDAYPEQLSPISNPEANLNLTDGLRPWQPEKIYYFSNPTHDIFAGRGPQYQSNDISPSRHVSYKLLAAQELTYHRTQGGARAEQAIQNQALNSTKDGNLELATAPVRLILGKSLVTSGITDDVFAGVKSQSIPFRPVSPTAEPENSRPALSIGDPWAFYHRFWHAHGLDHLADLVPFEVTVKVGGGLIIPLSIENPLDKSIDVNFSIQLPPRWETKPLHPITVPPHTQYFLRVRASAPSDKVSGWQDFTIQARTGSEDLGKISLRAELSTDWVAPQ
jgi:LmbE family N-acetylglucosaminyl deacetylase